MLDLTEDTYIEEHFSTMEDFTINDELRRMSLSIDEKYGCPRSVAYSMSLRPDLRRAAGLEPKQRRLSFECRLRG